MLEWLKIFGFTLLCILLPHSLPIFQLTKMSGMVCKALKSLHCRPRTYRESNTYVGIEFINSNVEMIWHVCLWNHFQIIFVLFHLRDAKKNSDIWRPFYPFFHLSKIHVFVLYFQELPSVWVWECNGISNDEQTSWKHVYWFVISVFLYWYRSVVLWCMIEA